MLQLRLFFNFFPGRLDPSYLMRLSRYYTQTRAIGAFASVGLENMAEAGRKGCMECMMAVAGNTGWGRRMASSANLRKVEMVQQPNDGEGDRMSLIQQEQV
jgi:hypothetical protein